MKSITYFYNEEDISNVFFALRNIVDRKRDLNKFPMDQFEVDRLETTLVILGQHILLFRGVRDNFTKALPSGITVKAIEQYPRLKNFFEEHGVSVDDIYWRLCVFFKKRELSMKSRVKLGKLAEKLAKRFFMEEEDKPMLFGNRGRYLMFVPSLQRIIFSYLQSGESDIIKINEGNSFWSDEFGKNKTVTGSTTSNRRCGARNSSRDVASGDY